MNHWQPHAHAPPTLADRLDQLTHNLQSLRDRLKAAIARALGSAVADAVRDAVQGLLGTGQQAPRFKDDLSYRHDRHRPAEERDWWSEDEQDEPEYQRPAPVPDNGNTNQRWPNALGAAAQATLWWLREQQAHRPVLSTTLVALTAGITAFAVGPTLVGGAGILASVVGLVLTAEAATSVARRLAGLAQR